MSDVYTHGHHASVLRSHTWRNAENSAGYLLPFLRPGSTVLDVGCGPGTITADLADRVAPGSIVGVDAAADIVEQAAGTHQRDNLVFQVEDCYHLSFESQRFDVVHAHQVLQHLSDPVAALVEMKRVVGSNGVVAVRDADYRGMFWYPRRGGLDRWMEVYQGVARRNRAEPDAGRMLVAWARAAGFSSITPSASTWCFATEADRRWWGGLWSERIQQSSLADQAIGYGLSDQSELAGLGQAWLEWAEHPDAWFAVVHGEVILRP